VVFSILSCHYADAKKVMQQLHDLKLCHCQSAAVVATKAIPELPVFISPL
jgi:hypothetical protein